MRPLIALASVAIATAGAWVMAMLIGLDAVGSALAAAAMFIACTAFMFGRVAFAGDRFARIVLLVIAAPVSLYLLRIAANH